MASDFVDVFENVGLAGGVIHNYKNQGATALFARFCENENLHFDWSSKFGVVRTDSKALVQKVLFEGYTETYGV